MCFYADAILRPQFSDSREHALDHELIELIVPPIVLVDSHAMLCQGFSGNRRHGVPCQSQ